MGQAPAQKAAKAARGQQPKKRPGTAQREAIKRAQAAKKKAGGGKPTAKKTTAKVTDGWGHPGCTPRKLSAAEREFARNKARIESGETYRAQKPPDWRRGASPSSTRPAR
ncbi:hypothetical protein [Streptomyces flavidovirens]|uniref:hypothetical protein n=1 Tax=Streptomyces flavidovirens TaxID=67298 RepID=UPI0036B0DE42